MRAKLSNDLFWIAECRRDYPCHCIRGMNQTRHTIRIGGSDRLGGCLFQSHSRRRSGHRRGRWDKYSVGFLQAFLCHNLIMPSRASMTKRPRDPNLLARSVMEDLIGEKMDGSPLAKPLEPPDTRNPAAVALSKLGASKGGKARAKVLSARKRKAIARKAAATRWRNQK